MSDFRNLDVRLQMEALITMREGMLATNMVRIQKGLALAYTEDSLVTLATQFEHLIDVHRAHGA